MICRSGMLKLQIRRALQSKTLPYAVLALMALVTVCFVQSCLMFGGTIGERSLLLRRNGWATG